jgi:hypothetical protein
MVLALTGLITASAGFGADRQSIPAVPLPAPPAAGGLADDDAWKDVQPVSGFIQFEPSNGDPSMVHTAVKVGYDSEALYVPPFGALQIAYHHGTSRFGTASEQGHTLFTKLSWVF